MSTGINVKTTKKPVSDEKSAKTEHKLSEESMEILKNLDKMDTNEKFYNIEDRIAMALTHEKLYEQSMEQYGVLREVLENYINGQKIEMNMITNIAKVRRLARLSHYATSQLRKESAEKLEIVDAKLLQLQNTTSELQHVRKEIDRCLDYSAGDEDIDLVPVEEFYKTASETISKPEETKNNEHKQYLARLQFEAEQRKEMQSTLHELEGRRNVLLSDIHKKEQRIESVIPNINELLKTTQPLQETLAVQFEDVDKVHEQRKLAVQLPPSLSLLYSHSLAYSEIMQDKSFSVKINKSEILEKEEPEGKRSKNENVLDRIERSANRIFENHPLNVEFEIGCGSQNVLVTFYHLSELQVLTAKWDLSSFKSSSQVLCAENLMTDLFENDDGVKCPNSTGNIKMQHLKLNFNEISKKLGRPYNFAQVLGGFLSADTETHLTESVRKLVLAIRNRVETRIQLDEVLKSIETKKSEILEIPKTSEFKMISFAPIEYEKFMTGISESFSSKISTISSGFYYKADFENSDKSKKLTVWIVIPPNYPQSSAILGFTVNFDEFDSKGLEESTIDLDLKSQLLNVALFKV